MNLNEYHDYRHLKESAKSRQKPEAAYGNLYQRIKGAAKKEGHLFELTKGQLIVLVKQNCHYCGIAPFVECYPTVMKGGRNGKAALNYDRPCLYNGIDRKDSSQGYFLENCVTCCKWCNYAKRNQGLENFLAWAKRVFEYQESLKKQAIN